VSAAAGAESFTVEGGGLALAGEEQAALEDVPGAVPIVLAHGLTATRRYVVHGSRLLARRGHRMISYDARGHGESDPAADGSPGYVYPELTADLAAVVVARAGEGRPLLAGHSMGAHTLTAYALEHASDLAGIVVVGPVVVGTPASDEALAAWDRLADGLASGGVEGFVEAYDRNLDPEWRDTLLRITRDRLSLHRHPGAVAQALREVPRSLPFEGLEALESLDVPALVVASHDTADPGHPYAVAAEWAERLPAGRLISEEEGSSPLAWQGGLLSREIAAFCDEPAVRERLA
jgi:3-oxoadipate enol-lactonase